eukprot:1158465-Pelagomonas_calceolata.AAC.3
MAIAVHPDECSLPKLLSLHVFHVCSSRLVPVWSKCGGASREWPSPSIQTSAACLSCSSYMCCMPAAHTWCQCGTSAAEFQGNGHGRPSRQVQLAWGCRGLPKAERCIQQAQQTGQLKDDGMQYVAKRVSQVCSYFFAGIRFFSSLAFLHAKCIPGHVIQALLQEVLPAEIGGARRQQYVDMKEERVSRAQAPCFSTTKGKKKRKRPALNLCKQLLRCTIKLTHLHCMRLPVPRRKTGKKQLL